MPSNLGAPAQPISSISLVGSGTTLDNDDPTSFGDLDGQDPAHQLTELNNRLMKQSRIKEGAENMLNMPLTDLLRVQVESELDMARNRIEAITNKRTDIQTTIDKGKQVNGAAAVRKKLQPAPSTLEERGDDFRTALRNANNSLASLLALGRPTGSNASSSPGASSSNAPSTSDIPEADRPWITAMSQLADILRKNVRVRYELNITDIVRTVIPALSDRRCKQCRAVAYRLIRWALIDHDCVRKLGTLQLEWYMVKSLSRDSKFAVEKEQVIKLIRAVVQVGTIRTDNLPGASSSGTVPLSEPVMRALVAVAEHTESHFRPICILTLTEILLIDIDLIYRTGGFRFLLHVLGEGPIELASMISAAFLHIIDSPRTRAYFTVGTDLEIVLSAITDAYGKGIEHAERMKGSTKIVQGMLRTWSGLMYFCMEDMRALRSIIDTLRIPSLESREVIINMFFDLLKIKTPEWYQTFIDGRRLTMYKKRRLSTDKTPEPRRENDASERMSQTLRLTDQYIALLVLIFTNAGLLDALTVMVQETTTGTNLSRKATLLMAEVLQLANRVLPLWVAARIQAIPQIFAMASDYRDNENRIIGTSAMSAIDSLDRNRARLQPGSVLPKQFRVRANSVEDPMRRGQRQVEQVKLKLNMQMDDKVFQAYILDTQVIYAKDHTKWNFEMLIELIEGPLLNPKRLEEAMKGTKFIRRLMAFFYPESHRFSDMPKIKANGKWVRLGCSVLTTLLASPDGVRYLATEDLFLKQIVKGFAQLDPFNGVQDADPIFSKKRVQETMTSGYLEMLGTLSRQKEGIELLERYKIFTAFYHLSELRSREDLIKSIIENLDYSIDGHPRIILSKALTSSYKHIRLYATKHLGDLIRGSTNNANVWTLRLLITQLYDPAPEVCEIAARFLEEACESKEILQLVVEMRPTMDHLGDAGNPLLLKFTSTPMGFRYLYDAGYIDRELDLWFNERNLYYVVQVEVFLSSVFNSDGVETDEETLAFEGAVPPHFYGEMAKTELGCQVLQDKGHFIEFTMFIEKHGLEGEDAEIIMKLKSILWAVGNVGATEGGLSFLEEEGIIPHVLKIANNSPIPSIRGTCFFVLGLIASTAQGAEILDSDYEWEATLSPLGTAVGLCIPLDVEKFITLPAWKSQGAQSTQPRLLPPRTEVEQEVITAVENLANSVIANAASRTLSKMKSRQEDRWVFSSPEMFYRALHIISSQRYRLPVRKYVMDLFNLELDAKLVTELHEIERRLKAGPTYKNKATAEENRKSMFGRLGKTRRQAEETSDSSGEDEGESVPGHVTAPKEAQLPPISCKPVEHIVGFNVVTV